MVKLKKKALFKMDWFENLTVATDYGMENEGYVLEITESGLILHNADPRLQLYIKKLEIGPPIPDQGGDLVVFDVRGAAYTMRVQIRFGSQITKSQFLERVFTDRNEDSGNSSPETSSPESSSSSPESSSSD